MQKKYKNTAEELDVITSEKSQKTKTNKYDIMDYNNNVEIDVALKRNHFAKENNTSTAEDSIETETKREEI